MARQHMWQLDLVKIVSDCCFLREAANEGVGLCFGIPERQNLAPVAGAAHARAWEGWDLRGEEQMEPRTSRVSWTV